MASFPRITSRPFVHVLAGSLIAGFAFQTEWAVQHDFESYATRVFLSALVLFVLLQALKALLKRARGSANGSFDDDYGELILLISVLPLFQIIENGFVQTIAIALYAAIVIGFAASVLGIQWCINLRNWFGDKTALAYSRITGQRLSYGVQDDIEPGVLHVRLRARDDDPPSADEIKSRLADLYQRLPGGGDFSAIKVNIDDVNASDDMLVRLLEPLSHYARISGLDRVAVLGPEQTVNRLSKILPEERYALQQSA